MSVVQTRDGGRTVLAVDDKEIAEARSVTARVAEVTRTPTAAEFEIATQEGQVVPIPSALADLMQRVLDGVSRGATLVIQSLPRELTTTTAAKMLGISRPTLMKLIADKELPAHKVGSHTRLCTSDVNAFRDRQREAQRRAFEELRNLDEELGIEP
jgi:excisionase family DNA binding protein